MSVYLVTYDLNRETKRPPIVEEIKKTAFAKLSESSYAIDTLETVSQVYRRFSRYIDDNDTLYVITLSRPWTGQGPEGVNRWLSNVLGPAG